MSIGPSAAVAAFLAAVVAGAATAGGGPSSSAPPRGGGACAPPFAGMRSAEVTFLLAVPRADTMPDTASAPPPGYGQLAIAARVGGAAAGRVTAALGGDQSIVLVPWGFDEACRPIRWTGSWLWTPVGAESFYRGRLRPAERWIGAIPTFDVYFAVWEGFPNSPWPHPMSAGRPMLSAAGLFELYDRLPTAEAIAARPYGAVSPLVAWRRDAGPVAARYPARTILTEAFRLAELARVRTAALPYRGTYRVRIERGDDTIASFLFRTGSVGTAPLRPAAGATHAVPSAPSPAPAYMAAAALARSTDRLAALSTTKQASACSRVLGLRAEAGETPIEGVAHAWTAELPPRFVAACFTASSILHGLRPAGTGSGFGGAFRQESDGRFTFRQPATLADGTTVILDGERIGLATLPAPPPVPDPLP